MQNKIIAVFGGSFNPPTKAHIDLAKQILDKMDGVEKVIFVPVSTKYNKNGLAPDEVRFNMLQKICNNYENIEVSSIELDSPRQLYTIETLKIIQNQYPNNEICFVIGTDNLKELDTWHKVEELISTFKIMVLKRDNDDMQEIIKQNQKLCKYENSFIPLDGIEPIDLSSSYIREKIQDDEDITGLVQDEIKEEVIKIYKTKRNE